MKYGSLFGWGIVIYAILRLVWSGLALYAFTQGLAPRLIVLFVLITISTIAGRALRFNRAVDILPYSFFWMFETAVLDAIFSVPLSGWILYADWNLWVGYALVATIPLLSPYTRKPDQLIH